MNTATVGSPLLLAEKLAIIEFYAILEAFDHPLLEDLKTSQYLLFVKHIAKTPHQTAEPVELSPAHLDELQQLRLRLTLQPTVAGQPQGSYYFLDENACPLSLDETQLHPFQAKYPDFKITTLFLFSNAYSDLAVLQVAAPQHPESKKFYLDAQPPDCPSISSLPYPLQQACLTGKPLPIEPLLIPLLERLTEWNRVLLLCIRYLETQGFQHQKLDEETATYVPVPFEHALAFEYSTHVFIVAYPPWAQENPKKPLHIRFHLPMNALRQKEPFFNVKNPSLPSMHPSTPTNIQNFPISQSGMTNALRHITDHFNDYRLQSMSA